MINADLIWHLVEILLQKEKNDSNQVALDQAKTNQTPNSTEHDEA